MTTSASARFMIGPMISTWKRCHFVFDRNSSEEPVRTSSGFSPAIFTYPPSGMALTQYSVSPLLKDRILGPNPSENVRTRTPMRRAIRKWPSSCTKISTPSTKMNARKVVTRTPCSFAGPFIVTRPCGRQRTCGRRRRSHGRRRGRGPLDPRPHHVGPWPPQRPLEWP